MDVSFEDGPPPLICKKELFDERYFQPRVVSIKESPILITLEDDDDDINGKCNNTDHCLPLIDISSEEACQNNTSSAEASIFTVAADTEFHCEEVIIMGDSNKEENDFHSNDLNTAEVGNEQSFSFTISDVYQLNSEVEGMTSHFKESGSPSKKSPVMILHEFCQQQNIKLEFELLSVDISKIDLEPVYQFRVRAGNIEALGTSKIKKKAKQMAAGNLLKKLSCCEKSKLSEQFRAGKDCSALNENPIGVLQEICVHRKWALPQYEETFSGGDNNFKIVCKVLKFQEIGLGRTKKLAKKDSALKMLEALKKSETSLLNNEKENTTEICLTGIQIKESQKTANQEKVTINEELELLGKDLYLCGNKDCAFAAETETELKDHLFVCDNARYSEFFTCPHCNIQRKRSHSYLQHLQLHGEKKYSCGLCNFASGLKTHVTSHMTIRHGIRQEKATWKEVSPKGHSVLIPKGKEELSAIKTVKRERSKRRIPDHKFLGATNQTMKNYHSGEPNDIPSVPSEGKPKNPRRRRPKILSSNGLNQKEDIVQNPLAEKPSSKILKYKCEICNEFESRWRKEVTKHLSKVHDINRFYSCKFCKMQTNQRIKFFLHFANGHQGETVSYTTNILKLVSSATSSGKQEWLPVIPSAFRKPRTKKIPVEKARTEKTEIITNGNE